MIRSIVRYLFCHFVQIDQQWNLSYDWHFLRHPNNNHFASSTKVIFMVARAALQKKQTSQSRCWWFSPTIIAAIKRSVIQLLFNFVNCDWIDWAARVGGPSWAPRGALPRYKFHLQQCWLSARFCISPRWRVFMWAKRKFLKAFLAFKSFNLDAKTARGKNLSA